MHELEPSKTIIALGNYDEAQHAAEASLQICEAALGPMHLETAWSYRVLGDLYIAQRSYHRAHHCYEHALRVFQAVLAPQHKDIEDVQSQLRAIAGYVA